MLALGLTMLYVRRYALGSVIETVTPSFRDGQCSDIWLNAELLCWLTASAKRPPTYIWRVQTSIVDTRPVSVGLPARLDIGHLLVDRRVDCRK